MKTSTKYIILLSCIAVACLLAYILKEDKPKSRDFAAIEKARTLRIVTDYNSLGYYVSSDTIAGFNHDLLKLLEQHSGLTFEVSVDNSLGNSLEGLAQGKYDVIARNIPVNTDMKNEVNFTNSIVRGKYVLVQRKAEFNNGIEPIRNHLSLAKKTIYIAKNSPVMLRLRNLSHEIGDTIYVVEDDTYEASHLAMMVASGEIDYAICEKSVAEKILKALPEADIETDIGFTHFEAWAVRKESPVLLDSLNAWIERLEKTREYKELFNRYYQ